MVNILAEVFDYSTVPPRVLLAAKAAQIYSTFMDTPPPPKVTLRRPELPWPTIWRRLWKSRLQPEESNIMFQLLHNILPLRGRLAAFEVVDGANCQIGRASCRERV